MSDKVSLFLVNATFVALVAASALTWAVVIVKAFQQRRTTRQLQAFTKAFENAPGIPSAADLKKHEGPLARLSLAGVDSWEGSAEGDDGHPADVELRRDLLERVLRQQLQRERRGAESGLPILASVGSTSPFVGLFGTVLGIIHALTAISGSGSASLEVVAGPIGEALIATAVGIGVAVPAVLAYNYFVKRLKGFVADLEDFANTFVGSAVRSSILRVGRSSTTRSAVEHALLQPEASA
jgi:biopolymer transport protein ExbB